MRDYTRAAIAGALCVGFTLCAVGLGSCTKDAPANQTSVAAGEDLAKNTRPSVQVLDERLKTLKDIRPRFASVYVDSLEGFFEDCGCTGSAVGGIPRAVGIASTLSDDSNVVLHGNLYAPNRAPSALGDESVIALRSVKERLLTRILEDPAARTRLASNQLAAKYSESSVESGTHPDLIDTSHLPIDESLLHCVAVDVRVNRTSNTASFAFRLLRGDVQMARVESPVLPTSARGRVIVAWCAWLGSGTGMHLESTLGIQASSALFTPNESLSTVQAGLVRQSLATLLRKYRVVVTAWSMEVQSHYPSHVGTQEIISREQVALAHIGGVSGTTSVSPAVAGIREACGTCHERALDTWAGSRHARAYMTLAQKGMTGNRECLGCHTQEVSEASGRPRVAIGHMAVTCGNCYSSGLAPPEQSCTACHTSLTDPDGHYRSKITSICSGGDEVTSGACAAPHGGRHGD